MSRLAQSLISQLSEFFDPERLGPVLAGYLVNLLVASIVLLLFFAAWQIIRSWVLPHWKKRLDKTSGAFLETMIKFVILLLAIFAALGAAGIKTTAVLASLGVVGLTIGFAARDTLSNIISGLLIFLDRPFTIDDLVEIEGNYGRVEKITLRSTRIITNDGKMLAVPNTEVMTKTVISYTNFPHLRLDIGVTIGVTEDIDRTREIMLLLVAKNPAFMKSPEPEVVVIALNDYNTGLELRVWLDNEQDHLKQRLALREAAFKALTQAGVDMPYQTIQMAPFRVALDESSAEKGKT
ncbi:MAG: mechanosensitive ion channel family protein [Candidatus Marinimicrobia bacterium]|nr:mechanosensitive ion channel family protein [Candidatus Neomarinimicrobiota bacterium]